MLLLTVSISCTCSLGTCDSLFLLWFQFLNLNTSFSKFCITENRFLYFFFCKECLASINKTLFFSNAFLFEEPYIDNLFTCCLIVRILLFFCVNLVRLLVWLAWDYFPAFPWSMLEIELRLEREESWEGTLLALIVKASRSYAWDVGFLNFFFLL